MNNLYATASTYAFVPSLVICNSKNSAALFGNAICKKVSSGLSVLLTKYYAPFFTLVNKRTVIRLFLCQKK
jgi:hypothetical protein